MNSNWLRTSNVFLLEDKRLNGFYEYWEISEVLQGKLRDILRYVDELYDGKLAHVRIRRVAAAPMGIKPIEITGRIL